MKSFLPTKKKSKIKMTDLPENARFRNAKEMRSDPQRAFNKDNLLWDGLLIRNQQFCDRQQGIKGMKMKYAENRENKKKKLHYLRNIL